MLCYGFARDLEDLRCFSRFSGVSGCPYISAFTPIIYCVEVSDGETVRFNDFRRLNERYDDR